MAVSLEFRFKGKEAKVLAEVERDGIKAVMKQYGLKYQYNFSKWIERHRDPVLSKLAGLNGGEKRLWMRNHRDTILDLLEIFGESFVMEKFHIHKEEALGKSGSSYTRLGVRLCLESGSRYPCQPRFFVVIYPPFSC